MITAAPKENKSTPAGRRGGAAQRKPSQQKSSPQSSTPENSLARVIETATPGTSSLGHVIHSGSIQPKISVSSPDDTYEKEADHMADQVMSAPATPSVSVGEGSAPAVGAASVSPLQNGNPAHSASPSITPVSKISRSPGASSTLQAKPDSQNFQMLQREVEEDDSFAQMKPGGYDLHRFTDNEEEEFAQSSVMRMEEEDAQAKADVYRFTDNEEEFAQSKIMRMEEEEEAQPKLMRMEEEEEAQTSVMRLEDDEAQTKIQRAADPKDEKKLIKPAKEEPVSIKYVRDVNNPKGNPDQQVQRKPGLMRRMYRKAKSLFSLNRSKSSSSPSASGSAKINASSETSGGSSGASGNFESSLGASKGGGSPLPANTKGFMESRFDADFSGVRVHTGGNAVQMSQQINAQAFTHGSDIYFNSGKYNPDTSSGKHLLAHELTHTVQQGAAPQNSGAQRKVQLKTKGAGSGGSASMGQPKVQRSWLGDAWDAVGDAASAVVDAAADALNAAIDYAKDKFADFARAIPGYKLLSVILGQDPISGREVARNGRNFIEAGLDIIPFGGMFQRKLEETGGMEEAATWLDQRMGSLNISLTSILNDIENFWDGLSLSDATDVTGTLERAANIIRRPIGEIVSFVGDVATEFLRIIKEIVITELATFVRDNTRGYPLLTVILGQDPITEQPVERNGMNLLTGFLELTEEGAEQRRQMEESGSLQKAAEWIDGAIATLGLGFEGIRNAFSQAWTLITIENLVTAPIQTFQEIVNLFAEPVGLILGFIIEVATMVLKFIKDALLARLSAFARETRGYPLLTVILGKDPFTEERVPRNAENLIHGFMSLMDGGEEQFQQMKETGAIARMTARIEAAVDALNFTWEYIKGLFITAWESFSLQDLAAPFEAFGRIVSLFADPIRRLFNFVVEVIKMAVEIILVIMRFPIGLVQNIITKAMQAIEDIKRDPIGFFKNLLKAIKQGFQKFFDNILTHLFNGLTNWLFSELEDAGINPPADFSLGSIFEFVLDVLGITMERIWAKLAERIGQDRVDRIRGMIDRLTGIWTFVRDVMERGPIAIWEYIMERINNLWDMVLEHIRNWVMTRIIERVTARLLSMLDPTGIMAVVNSVISLYQAIESFIRYIREMLEIVNSFVEGVAEIARGDTNRAATFLEGALARGVPVAIGFLANQVGLSGLGRRIGEMIEAVRERVDQGLDWLMDRALAAGTAFLNGITGAGGSGEEAPEHDPEKQARIDAGLAAITTEENNRAENGKLTREQAEEVATTIRANHQVFSSFVVVDGGDSWNYRYTASPEQTVDTPNTTKAEGGDVPTSARPVYGGLEGGKYGSSVEVDGLTSTLGPEGSVTSSSHTHSHWEKLRKRRQGGRTWYVKGHLLNNHLGGPGRDWRNLTPMFQNDNSSFESGFEGPVKDAVDEGVVVHFSVSVNYGRTLHSKHAQMAAGNVTEREVAEVMEAETLVPTSVNATATRKDVEGTPETSHLPKTHNIPYNFTFDPDSDDYSLSGSSRERVYLPDLSPGQLQSNFGLTAPQARAVEAVVDQDEPRRWDSLLSAYRNYDGRLSPGAIDNIKESRRYDVKLFRG